MYKLHRSGIVLRCLDLDAIGLRQSSENPNEYKFDKIITYSFARCLKVGDGILQQLHMTGESKVNCTISYANGLQCRRVVPREDSLEAPVSFYMPWSILIPTRDRHWPYKPGWPKFLTTAHFNDTGRTPF